MCKITSKTVPDQIEMVCMKGVARDLFRWAGNLRFSTLNTNDLLFLKPKHILPIFSPPGNVIGMLLDFLYSDPINYRGVH